MGTDTGVMVQPCADKGGHSTVMGRHRRSQYRHGQTKGSEYSHGLTLGVRVQPWAYTSVTVQPWADTRGDNTVMGRHYD